MENLGEDKKLEAGDGDVQVQAQKTYKYKLNIDKTSGVGLKNGKMVNIVNKTIELTENDIVENLAIIKKELITFVGSAKDDPSKKEEIINKARGAVTQSLSEDTMRMTLLKEVEEAKAKMVEQVTAYEKTIAEQKKEITKLTKENKELVVENDKLQKDLKAAK